MHVLCGRGCRGKRAEMATGCRRVVSLLHKGAVQLASGLTRPPAHIGVRDMPFRLQASALGQHRSLAFQAPKLSQITQASPAAVPALGALPVGAGRRDAFAPHRTAVCKGLGSWQQQGPGAQNPGAYLGRMAPMTPPGASRQSRAACHCQCARRTVPSSRRLFGREALRRISCRVCEWRTGLGRRRHA